MIMVKCNVVVSETYSDDGGGEYSTIECQEHASHVHKVWDLAVALCPEHEKVWLSGEEIEWSAIHDADEMELLQDLIQKE